MVVVPRLFEMLRTRIMKSVESSGKLSNYLLAKALQISAETLYVRAGLLTEEDAKAPSVREAVGRDPLLTAEQKQVILGVYDSYVGK